jgi:hypothetical protein
LLLEESLSGTREDGNRLSATAPFASWIYRILVLPGLSTDEASLLLAKELLPKRRVEDLGSTYLFDREATATLNGAADGNPRRLLKEADLAIEDGVGDRPYRVGADTLRTVLARSISPVTVPEVSTGASAAKPFSEGLAPSRAPKGTGTNPVVTRR